MADKYYRMAQDIISRAESEGLNDPMQEFADGLELIVNELTERWQIAISEAKEQG